MTFAEFSRTYHGGTWGVCRPSVRNSSRYAVCITAKQHEAAQMAYLVAGGNANEVNPAIAARVSA